MNAGKLMPKETMNDFLQKVTLGKTIQTATVYDGEDMMYITFTDGTDLTVASSRNRVHNCHCTYLSIGASEPPRPKEASNKSDAERCQDEAIKSINEAILHLSAILIQKANGHGSFNTVYRGKLRDSMNTLMDILENLD